MTWPPTWPRVLDAEFGPPSAGEYRATPEDFQVAEVLDFAPEGEGEHLWLHIEKRDLTTAMAVRDLARLCEVSPRDVGYSGMKDRVAVTLNDALAECGIRVLAEARHPRKLKRGVHRANRFRLRITGAALEDPELEARWARLVEHGVANYFGPQRFGPDGRNLQRARSLLARGWRKRDDRDGMLLSAARSFLFNELLAERVHEGSWNRLLAGEVAILDGTASQFSVEAPDDELDARAARLDLHPSGILWGVGDSVAKEEALALESRLTERYPALCAGLEHAQVRLARRSLRLRLREPSLTRGENALWLAFSLPRGAFATAVLRELIAHPTL
ncbi:MAG: tRNA pseudouridine(13) synthase TruD [Halomonas sp.]|nr:tRNA pseudouridine(13) synthase TruD [Halomonas sp.]